MVITVVTTTVTETATAIEIAIGTVIVIGKADIRVDTITAETADIIKTARLVVLTPRPARTSR